MAVYIVSLLVLVVASILCTNTCQHGQAVILDFKEQINDIRLRRAPGQSLCTSGNANHQQLMMPSVEDIGTQLKRIGRDVGAFFFHPSGMPGCTRAPAGRGAHQTTSTVC